MITTETYPFIQASKIESAAGRCFNCRRFRYCSYKSDCNLICDDCVTIFKNRKLLSIITPSPPKPFQQIKRQRKRLPKAKKLNPSTTKQRILQLLLSHPFGLKFAEIAIASGTYDRAVERALQSLLKSEEIIFSRHRNGLYYHKEHSLNTQKAAKVIPRLKDLQAAKDALDNHSNTCTAKDLRTELNKGRNSILRCLRFLASREEIYSFTDPDSNTTYFASKNNPEAVQSFEKLISESLPNKILNCLNSEKTIPAIAREVGKQSRKGIVKVLEALEREGKIQKIQVGAYYYYKKID